MPPRPRPPTRPAPIPRDLRDRALAFSSEYSVIRREKNATAATEIADPSETRVKMERVTNSTF